MEARKRTHLLVLFVIVMCVSGGGIDAADAPPASGDVEFWSVAGLYQQGPDDRDFYGARFVRLVYCDDDVCHTPVTWFWGGEVMAADQGGIARGLASFSIFSFPFGRELESVAGRRRLSLWVRPTVGVEYAWDVSDEGMGVDAGFGVEFIVRPGPRSQLGLGWDRYFSTIVGSRSQFFLTYRWGIRK